MRTKASIFRGTTSLRRYYPDALSLAFQPASAVTGTPRGGLLFDKPNFFTNFTKRLQLSFTAEVFSPGRSFSTSVYPVYCFWLSFVLDFADYSQF